MPSALEVLGITVSPALLGQWVQWLAPQTQPFLVGSTDSIGAERELPFELLDTYELYGVADHLRIAWLTEQEFLELPQVQRAELVRGQVRLRRSVVPAVRRWGSVVGEAARSQADGHRFVWWPSLLGEHGGAVLAEFVDNGRRPSRHRQVSTSTWKRAERLLPWAKEIGGTFADTSGPNCFGAVMGAAGSEGAAREWMQPEPFEAWLSESTVPGGKDSQPGTVLVWRSPTGEVQHAAVTLGDGWALHKPSQGWMSPTKVLTVADVKNSSRCWGRRLTRRQLVG